MTERIKRAAEQTRANVARVLGEPVAGDDAKLLSMIRTALGRRDATEMVMLLGVLEDHFARRVCR